MAIRSLEGRHLIPLAAVLSQDYKTKGTLESARRWAGLLEANLETLVEKDPTSRDIERQAAILEAVDQMVESVKYRTNLESARRYREQIRNNQDTRLPVTFQVDGGVLEGVKNHADSISEIKGIIADERMVRVEGVLKHVFPRISTRDSRSTT